MAGLTGRMSTVVKAKVSKLLDRAEDPAETLDYSYQKQVEQLQNVKKGIADVVTAKKRLQLQETTLQQQLVKLDTQARQALSSGQEDLAGRHSNARTSPKPSFRALTLRSPNSKPSRRSSPTPSRSCAPRSRRFAPRRRSSRPNTRPPRPRCKISEAATGVGEQMADVGLAMQRAVDKTENMKARADAVQSSKRQARSTTSPRSARAKTTSTAS